SELAVPASHCRCKGQQRCKQNRFYPEIPPQVCDRLIRRRHTLLAPLQVSEGRRNREQAYDHQCADLGPEEQVVSVIVPPLVAKIARPNPTNTISPASMPYQASIAATRRAAAASMPFRTFTSSTKMIATRANTMRWCRMANTRSRSNMD